MNDRWVEDRKTGDAWRLDTDPRRPIYLSKSGEIRSRDGAGWAGRYIVHPCCPKAAPQNKNIPETGEQITIFDFMDSEKWKEEEPAGADAAPEEYHEAFRLYLERGYRPRIADALAREALGMENPDAFLLKKFHITGEDLKP